MVRVAGEGEAEGGLAVGPADVDGGDGAVFTLEERVDGLEENSLHAGGGGGEVGVHVEGAGGVELIVEEVDVAGAIGVDAGDGEDEVGEVSDTVAQDDVLGCELGVDYGSYGVGVREFLFGCIAAGALAEAIDGVLGLRLGEAHACDGEAGFDLEGTEEVLVVGRDEGVGVEGGGAGDGRALVDEHAHEVLGAAAGDGEGEV